jgi:class 3 adenylate cyclase
MEGYQLVEAAARCGLGADELRRLVDMGVIESSAGERFTRGDLRRASLVSSLATAGISLDALGAAIRDGHVSLAFLDAPAFDRFAQVSDVTFAEMADRSGVPIDILLSIRESSGSVAPAPDDRMRDAELPLVAWLQAAQGAGARLSPMLHVLRVQADGLRRMAETEAAWWQSEVIGPAEARGERADEVLGADFGDRMSELTEQALISMYHLQQTKAWTRNLVEGVEAMLSGAGLHSRLERLPAMCFFDITGYTQLTQEHGDAAAADMADRLGAIVGRASVEYGGRAVKWLGDGVMVHFPHPGQGVLAAIDMAERVTAAGMPPAHVGLHAGPVVFQQGDYYGSTVNIAARIADVARPHEVVVSQAVVDAADDARILFRAIGPVALKGVAAPVELHLATRAE